MVIGGKKSNEFLMVFTRLNTSYSGYRLLCGLGPGSQWPEVGQLVNGFSFQATSHCPFAVPKQL